MENMNNGTNPRAMAVIEGGVVVNVIAVDDDSIFTPEFGAKLVELPDGFWIGDTFKRGKWKSSKPTEAVAFPSLTRLQFFSGLVSLGLTKAALMAKLAEVHTDPIEFEKARIFVEENQSFERCHPMVSALGPLFGVTPEQIDAAWLAAASV